MALEIKNTLAQIDADIGRNNLQSARKRLADLMNMIENDHWLDNTSIQDSAELLALTSQPYDNIAGRFKHSLLASIKIAEEWHDPFRVRVMPQTFAPELYKFLCDTFPTQKFLKPRLDKHFMRDGQFQRYETVLTSEALAGAGHTVRKLWLGLAKAFDLKTVREALCTAVGAPIPQSWTVDIRVMVDRCGFNMAPHTDGGNGGILTFMMYLPRDGQMRKHGTEFFRKTGDTYELVRKRGLDPNAAHAFAITKDSWHGLVSPIPKHAEERRSLVVRYIRT